MTSLKLPVIFVNMKSYEHCFGSGALKFGMLADEIMKETGVTIVLSPQHVDIFNLAQNCEVPIFAQHLDGITSGRGTGLILPEAVKEAGALGSLLNHSERQLSIADIESGIRRCREVGLETLVCSNNAATSAAISALNPDFVAVEPPELIGTGVSVSMVKPEVVTDTVKRIKQISPKVQVLTGAGISSDGDVEAALKLGTNGVLVSSAVTKATDPKMVLKRFADAMRKKL